MKVCAHIAMLRRIQHVHERHEQHQRCQAVNSFMEWDRVKAFGPGCYDWKLW
jgi:hypothetical protein